MQNTKAPLPLPRYAELLASAAARNDTDGAIFWAMQHAEAERMARLSEYAEFDAFNADYQAELGAAEDARWAAMQAAVEAERARRTPPMPNYVDTPGADVREYKAALGQLWHAIHRAKMSEAGRIEGASKYLQLEWLTSFRQLSPSELHTLRLGIIRGALAQDWTLAGSDESACDWEQLSTVDEDDFARIAD